MTVHICAPEVQTISLKKGRCPFHEDENKSIIMSEFYPWYGWEFICLKCGDAWTNEELRERPFIRGWREKRIKDALKRLERNLGKLNNGLFEER